MMRVSTAVALSTFMLCASGCTNLSKKVDERFNSTNATSTRLIKQIGQTKSNTKAAAPITYDNGLWLGKNSIKLEQPVVLPAIFYEPATFDRTVYSLSELAERITLRAGIPTKVTPDADAAASRTMQGSNPAAGNTAQSTGMSALPTGTLGGTASTRTPFRIIYANGNFKGLLDTASARLGVFWKYVDGTLLFYFTDTRTFQIHAIPGDSALSATVASGADSTASSSGSTSGISANNSQNTAVKSQLSVYSSIEKSVGAMLSTYGKVVASPATGSLTVVDTPDTLDRVAQLIDSENKRLSRQIMLSVTVLSVTLSGLDNYGIDWGLVYNNMSSQYGIKNTFPTDSNTPGKPSFAAAILNTASSKLAGSSAIINALSEQGKVRRETTASVVTLNDQPVPVQVAKQTTYLKSSQTTITASVGTSTTLTPGTVVSGFNMTLLPHVLNDGTVMLQFSTDISALRNIRTVSSNGSSIESPELDTRNFLQRVAMRSNETLIISGFEQTDDNLDQQGVGRPNNFLLGGGFKAQANKEIIVILITPVAMNTI